MKKAWTLALLGGLASLSFACWGHEEKTDAKPAEMPSSPTAAAPAPGAAPGSPAAPSPDKPKWHPKSEEVYEQKKAAQPNAQITEGSLPAGFPTDLPLYPDAKPKTSMMVQGEGLVVLDSPAQMADVLAHFREQLPAQGWTVDSVKEASGGTKATVKAHKDMRSATISVNQSQGGSGTEIGIALKGSS
jgi:hypothetical protein